MNDTPLTIAQAFDDLFRYLKSLPAWATIPRPQKQELYKAAQDNRRGMLGERRFARLADTYAPGRYRIEVAVYINF